jgi:hypothetical protein
MTLLPPSWVQGTNIAEGVIPIYLKRIRQQGACHYIISETYADHGILKSRDLMDLGPDPASYIQYFDRHSFGFQSVIEENLQKKGVRFRTDEIERIFRPFLKPEIRRIIETFDRSPHFRMQVSCNLAELAPGQRKVHMFDARRLYYLRFGRIDSGELGRRNWKFLNVFLCRSRDEIESDLDTMELPLPTGEYAAYVYASLGIPLVVPHHLREYPSALDRENLDRLVLQELCRINSDEEFFLGVQWENDSLHPYLSKYAWLYFDSEFQSPAWFESFRSQMDLNKTASARSVQAAFEIFEISAGQFSRMSGKELTRLFRLKAKKIHPDKGGEHENFLRLSEAYDHLMKIKKRTDPVRN